MVGIVGVLALINVWLLVPPLVVGYVFYLMRNYYLKTSRGVKRLEGISKNYYSKSMTFITEEIYIHPPVILLGF